YLSISGSPDSTPTSSRRMPERLHSSQTSSGSRTPWSARMVAAQVNRMPESTICCAMARTRSRLVKKVSSWKFRSSKRYFSHSERNLETMEVGSIPTHLRPYTNGSEQNAQRKLQPCEEM